MIGTGFPENAGRAVMNGVHDMGGMDGFGKVEPEPNEPMFHTEWEARVLAMVRAMGAAGAFNIDTSRFYRETLPPHVYLSSSYYKKWLLGLEDLLVDKGFIAAEDVAAGHAVQPPKPLKRGKFTLADVERIMVRGKFGRAAPAPAKFKAGDRVRAKNIHPATHTRLPRYVRGHVGVVERDHGCQVFPDSAAIGSRREPAMALHRRVRRRRTVGRGRRSDGQDLHRRVRAVSGARHDGRRGGARATAAVPGIPRDDDGPVFREPWEAQAFAMALALHERGAVHLERMGGDARRRDQARAGRRRSRHRRDLLPALARDAGDIWSPPKASRRPKPCIATATPGTTPPTARRTARRSN